jgi:FAD/FMN-containing dehydrogenase
METTPPCFLGYKIVVFAFVLYYKQGTTEADKAAVSSWTRELIDAALSVNGSYYLPYQIHATAEQFFKAYPRSEEFFALKARLDPENKFRNKLWDAYYPAPALAGKKAD